MVRRAVALALASALSMFGGAEVASADTLRFTIGQTTGVFTDVTGGFFEGTNTVTGVGTDEVRWGVPFLGDEKSGLRYDGEAPPAFDVQVGEEFTVGALTHFNHPIVGGSQASAAALRIDVVFDSPEVDGEFGFTFGINETPNHLGAPASDDIITFLNSFAAETFTVGDQEFTLEIIGFMTVDGQLVDEFRSPEGTDNMAFLTARIVGPPPSEMPEPATLALLGAGVASVALHRRLRR